MRFRKWAFCSTVFSAVAVILFSISMGTEHWIDGIVYKGQNNDTAQIGFINFGLFRGEYSINFGLTDRQESFAGTVVAHQCAGTYACGVPPPPPL